MDGVRGVVLGCIMAIIGAIILVITMATTMVMCGMTLGLIPISTTIIPVGIMAIIMVITTDTILTSVLVAQGGAEEVPRCFPITVLRRMLRQGAALRAHHAQAPRRVVREVAASMVGRIAALRCASSLATRGLDVQPLVAVRAVTRWYVAAQAPLR